MSFGERMKEIFEQGWEASREFVKKAGAKAQDLGEKSALIWEIKQLECKAKKLITSLGSETYTAFTEHKQTSISLENIDFKIILDEITSIKEQIETKETELKNRNKQPNIP